MNIGFNGLDLFLITVIVVSIIAMTAKCKSMAKERDSWRHEALEISKELKDTKEMVQKLRDAVRKLQR